MLKRSVWLLLATPASFECVPDGHATPTAPGDAYRPNVDEVERLPDDEILDDEHVEAWERRTDEPNLRGVGAYRSDHDEWPWNVDVWVAEFLRDEPLETELTTGVESAIRSVPGVDDVHHEDREVWIVSGIPDGRALVQAVAAFIDGLAPRARPFVEGEE